MSQFDTILFDLDGTLTDPKIGITTCVQYALSKFGIEEPDLDKLEPFIGPPLLESFMGFYSFSEENARLAINYYRERFSVIGLYENSVYPGIERMLTELKKSGRTLLLATSKPTVYSVTILKHFKLYDYFDVIVGSELDGTRTAKSEVIDYAVNQLLNYNKENMVMVGDRMHDIVGAFQNHIKSIGVTYGYGSEDELKASKATYIVHSVQELKELLLKMY